MVGINRVAWNTRFHCQVEGAEASSTACQDPQNPGRHGLCTSPAEVAGTRTRLPGGCLQVRRGFDAGLEGFEVVARHLVRLRMRANQSEQDSVKVRIV